MKWFFIGIVSVFGLFALIGALSSKYDRDHRDGRLSITQAREACEALMNATGQPWRKRECVEVAKRVSENSR